eukprot:m.358577 g.358577  ORF g.358577 m.358577 type:complete len:102 (-) comp18189_c0_seq1:1554-1859(-)
MCACVRECIDFASKSLRPCSVVHTHMFCRAADSTFNRKCPVLCNRSHAALEASWKREMAGRSVHERQRETCVVLAVLHPLSVGVVALVHVSTQNRGYAEEG